MTERITVRTTSREELVDITDQLFEIVNASGIREGTMVVFSLHTTCSLTVNEGYDPTVVADMIAFMRRLVPQESGFSHTEGNSDSHIKVAFFGPSLHLIIEEGELLLGRWQRVFLAEWDGPRRRQVAVRITGERAG